MATNTGSNGGKNNTGGVIRGGTEGFADRGLASALEQQAYRKEYANKVFDKDTGYLANNIKVLQDQAKYYEKMLKSSQDLDKVQTKMYKKRLAEVRQLEAQTKQMQDRREASESEISKVLINAHKARLKQLDDECQRELNNIKEVGKKREEQQKKIAANYAAEKELIQDELDEIEVAADKAGKATKKVSTGLSESIKDITSSIMNLTNMINLESLANNEYTKKANERYEVINKLNRTLGFNIQQGTAAYNSITSEFKTFNNNIGNLFNIDDMREYMQNAATMGLTNEKALKDNLQQSVIANKYMGLNYDTQTSMYKYMKITNNNDAIASYNKMMVALTRKNVGINEDMLSEMIKSGQTTNDILAASGVDVAQYNQGKMAMVGSLKEKGYTDDMAQQMVGMVDSAIQSLYSGDYQNLVGMGINPNQLNSMTTGGASFDALYDYIVGARKNTNSSARGIGAGIIGMGEYNKALGRDISGEALASIYGNEDSETAKDLMKEVQSISKQDVTNYTKQNTAIDDLTRLSNANNVWLEDTFGNSWFDYSKMAKLAFGAAIAGNVVNAVVGISKGVGGLAKFFGTGGGAKLASLLGTGTGSTIVSSIGGVAKALGPLAVVAAGIKIGQAYWSYKLSKEKEDFNEGVQGWTNYYTSKGLSTNAGNVGAIGHKSEDATKSHTGFGWDTIGRHKSYDEAIKEWDIEGPSWYSSLTGGMAPIWLNSYLGTDLDTAATSSESWTNKLSSLISNKNYDAVNAMNLYSAIMMGNPKDKKNIIAKLLAYSMFANSNPNYKTQIEQMFSNSKIDGLTSVLSDDEIRSAIKEFEISKDLMESTHPSFYSDSGENVVATISNYDRYFTDGYHLAGLNRVPKDNYRALLHKDEMVLNKAEAQRYRAILGKRGYGFGGSLNASAPDYVGAHHAGYAGHNGIDLYFSEVGTPVGSAVPGKVIESRDIPVDWNDGRSYHGADSNGTHYSSYGRVVKVRGDDGHTYIYGHLNERVVKAGDQVGAGTLLGYSGTTGNSSGPHLHFEVADAGTGEAAHAKYYTPYVRSANGAAAQTGVLNVNSGDTNSDGSRRGAILATVNSSGVRAIPGFGGGSSSGPSSTDRIVKSVDGVSDKIIKYLDEIRQEQADQRRLINAFSASQTSIENYR